MVENAITIEKVDALELFGKIQDIISKQTESLAHKVLISFDNHKGIVQVRNANVSFRSEVPLVSKQAGTVLLPGKQVYDIIRRLPNAPVKITVSDNHKITITCKASKFTLSGREPEDYHVVPLPIDTELMTVKRVEFLRCLNDTFYATKLAMSRVDISGIHIKIGDGEIVCTSTDGLRLSRAKMAHDTPMVFSGIIHFNGLKFLVNMISRSREEIIQIGHCKESFCFETGGGYIFITNLKAQYPNTDAIFSTESKQSFIVDREEFVSVIERVQLAADTVKCVKLSFYEIGGHQAYAEFMGNEAREFFSLINDSDKKQDVVELHISAIFLLDAIGRLNTPHVSLGFSGKRSPVKISSPGDDSCVGIIMPIIR